MGCTCENNKGEDDIEITKEKKTYHLDPKIIKS